MASLNDVVKRINSLTDSILNDMIWDNTFICEEERDFYLHLTSTKSWFSRVSWISKKLYLLGLLEDVQYVWTLSLVLKSIWNCRLKDSVLSVCGPKILSGYDQVPMDHNRTALPLSKLAQVMTDDRKWFNSLEPESQAIVLSELAAIAGGPVMWEILKHAQEIYQQYCDLELQNLQELVIVNSTSVKDKLSSNMVKKEPSHHKSGETGISSTKISTKTHPQLEESLAVWNGLIKSMRDGLKVEDMEMTFKDGTTKKIWKVDRPKTESMETVDFLQLLPSAVGKQILTYLPLAQLGELARVNKYWAFLVDELKSEVNVRQKINIELQKIQEMMQRHVSPENDTQFEIDLQRMESPPGSFLPSTKNKSVSLSVRANQRSGFYSLRQTEKAKNRRICAKPKPIRNMTDLYERLERRGAADENIWKWCRNVLKHYGKIKDEPVNYNFESVVSLENMHFPCPLMKYKMAVPLSKPLVEDPTAVNIVRSLPATVKILKKNDNGTSRIDVKQYSLWSKDFSTLYPVLKLPSHQTFL